MQADLRPKQLFNQSEWELVPFIEVDANLGGQLLLSERAKGVEKHL